MTNLILNCTLCILACLSLVFDAAEEFVLGWAFLLSFYLAISNWIENYESIRKRWYDFLDKVLPE